MVYKWKEGTPFRADPAIVATEITKLGDYPTPRDVMDAARSPKSELHLCFEWDDTLAGVKYRLIQAQKILYSLVAVEKNAKGHDKEIRPFICESMHDKKQAKIVKAVVRVRQDEHKPNMLIDVIIKQAETIAKRLESVEGCADAEDLILEAVEILKRAREKQAVA